MKAYYNSPELNVIEIDPHNVITQSGMREYNPQLLEVSSVQQRYLRSLQLGSGALLNETDGDTVNPYFANLAGIALLSRPSPENISVVTNYISWYLNHLNTDGSINDYRSDGITSRNSYEMKDSCAASFLILLEKLHDVDPDILGELASMGGIQTVASALVSCIGVVDACRFIPKDKDYLSVSEPIYGEKFLMSNCEVNRALKSAIILQKSGLLPPTIDYAALLKKNTSGIESRLWSESNGMYDWYAGRQSGFSSWESFDPDAVVQLWPIIFGVLDSHSPRAVRLYDDFVKHYPVWAGRHIYDQYPLASVCYAASLVGDQDSVETFMAYLYSFNKDGIQKPWWYIVEATWTVLASGKCRI